MLYKSIQLLSRLGNSVLPHEFNAIAVYFVILNVLDGGKGRWPDLLGMGSSRGSDLICAAGAKLLLVWHVYLIAERYGTSLAEARRRVLPGELDPRTWQGWQLEAARHGGVSIAELGARPRAAARGQIDAAHSELDGERAKELWRLAYRPR
jgi:hypothetical protein